MSSKNRYSRQLLVNQIGESGQERIADAHILIVGAGGLGCQVGAQLAGAGVGHIVVVDHDVVDLSNLHRQILYCESDIGQPKAKVAVRELRSFNSEIEVNGLHARLGLDNVISLVKSCELIVDAADNFATTYLLSDACKKLGKPLLSASVNRTFGYVGIFCGSTDSPAPSMRAVFPKLPAQQQSCDTVGVTGPSVGIIASIQAQEALKIILNDQYQLLGKILYCDLWNYKQHIVDFSSATEPKNSTIKFIRAREIIESDTVIDVRNKDETTQLPQQFRVDLQVPLGELLEKTPKLLKVKKHSENQAKDRRIVLACQSGQRALIGVQQLFDQGYQNVVAVLPDSQAK